MFRPTKKIMTAEIAEQIAARALLFLAEDERRLGRFLAETGLDPATLRRSMGKPELLIPVLAFLLADESQLLVFAAGAGLPPEDIGKAHALLEGQR